MANAAKQYGVTLRGIGTCLPETRIYNDSLTSLVDTSDEWIYSRTGFKARHVVSGDEKMTDLAIGAAKDAMAFAGISGEDVDLIINASSTPDYIYPAGVAVIQQGIGAHRAFGFDMAMGCSGLIFALGTAMQFIENGTAKTALVLGADTHSRYTDWYDRNTCVLFGDGATCLVVTRTESAAETDILAMDFLLDGAKGQEIKLPVNRDNCPLVAPRTFQEKSAIYMNGREVFKFAVGEVPRLIEETVKRAGLTPNEVDYYILHQANARIMTAMAERMNIRPEQMIVSLEHYGNTSAASIGLALKDSVVNGTVQPGMTLVFCGFGAGLAVATTVVKWNCVDQRTLSTHQTDATQSASPQSGSLV